MLRSLKGKKNGGPFRTRGKIVQTPLMKRGISILTRGIASRKKKDFPRLKVKTQGTWGEGEARGYKVCTGWMFIRSLSNPKEGKNMRKGEVPPEAQEA